MAIFALAGCDKKNSCGSELFDGNITDLSDDIFCDQEDFDDIQAEIVRHKGLVQIYSWHLAEE